MKWTCVAAALLLVASMTGSARAAALSSTDAAFVKTAQADLLGEYALAALARGKAQNPELKSAATAIAKDTDKATQFLKSYAASHAVALDNKPTIRADEQYGNIQSLSGSAFDQAYAQALSVDSQLQLADFQDEARHGSDATLKAFAQREATMLQQASTVAQKLNH